MNKFNRQSKRELGRRRANARWRRPLPGPENLTADDAYYRMLEDRRGFVVREGCDYLSDGRVRPWCVRYAVRGRTDQYEGVYDGRVVKRGGMRVVDTVLKRRRR